MFIETSFQAFFQSDWRSLKPFPHPLAKTQGDVAMHPLRVLPQRRRTRGAVLGDVSPEGGGAAEIEMIETLMRIGRALNLQKDTCPFSS